MGVTKAKGQMFFYNHFLLKINTSSEYNNDFDAKRLKRIRFSKCSF